MGRRILFLSSADPLHGPGRLAWDMYQAMLRGGYRVDFHTQYSVAGHPEIHALCGDAPDIKTRIYRYLFTRVQKPAYYFFYGREECPPVPVSRILERIDGDGYDMILIAFWQGLLSFETVKRLWEKYRAPVVFATMDCSVMTGGCHYPHGCTRYRERCGSCPGLRGFRPDTFTRHNVAYRESFYDQVDPVILCNTYVGGIFRESTLLRDRRISTFFPVVDETQFRPQDKTSLRSRFGIPSGKRFVMLAGAQNFRDDRKGGRYLVEAVNLFYDRLSPEDREGALLLTVGTPDPEMDAAIRIDHRPMGYVDLDTLSCLYSLSDVFLSPSVEDAGPLMVNQALSCGTPVVCFRIGTAIDVVDGRGTGFCAPLRDAGGFQEGIFRCWSMDAAEREAVSARCREVALETTSYSTFAALLDTLFNKE